MEKEKPTFYKSLTIIIFPNDFKLLQKIAKKENQSLSEIMRRALREYAKGLGYKVEVGVEVGAKE